MTRRETSGEIDQAAAAWAARVERGALTLDEEASLDAWRAADRRRAGAFVKAQAVLAYVDRARALGPNALGHDGEPGIWSRRVVLRGGVAAVAATVAGIVGSDLWLRTNEIIRSTEYGKVQSFPLADGSMVTLDAKSKIRIELSSERRTVKLIAGRALFDVAKDPERPFVVQVGDVSAWAVGTSFSVEQFSDGNVQLFMREGIVEVTNQASPSLKVRLEAHNSLLVAPSGRTFRDDGSEQSVERALAWQSEIIDLDGTTLQAASIRFAQHSEYTIIVDPSVRSERITGRFAATDPRGFAVAAAASLGIQASIGAQSVRLNR